MAHQFFIRTPGCIAVSHVSFLSWQTRDNWQPRSLWIGKIELHRFGVTLRIWKKEIPKIRKFTYLQRKIEEMKQLLFCTVFFDWLFDIVVSRWRDLFFQNSNIMLKWCGTLSRATSHGIKSKTINESKSAKSVNASYYLLVGIYSCFFHFHTYCKPKISNSWSN